MISGFSWIWSVDTADIFHSVLAPWILKEWLPKINAWVGTQSAFLWQPTIEVT